MKNISLFLLLCALLIPYTYGMDTGKTPEPQETQKKGSLLRQMLEQRLANYDAIIATHRHIEQQGPPPANVQRSFTVIAEQREKIVEQLKTIE